MGVKNLFTALEQRGYRPRRDNLAYSARGQTVVVDGSNFIRAFCGPRNTPFWSFGGPFVDVERKVRSFVEAFRSAGIRLSVVFDGGIAGTKLVTWRKRRRVEVKTLLKALEYVGSHPGASAIPEKLYHPPVSKVILAECFAAAGARVVTAIGEADAEIAQLAQGERCYGVASADSDFLVFPGVARVLKLDPPAAMRRGRIMADVWDTSEAARALGLADPRDLTLLGVLSGNDTFSLSEEGSFHRRVMAAYPAKGSSVCSIAMLLADERRRGVMRGTDLESAAEWLEGLPIAKTSRDKLTNSLMTYKTKPRTALELEYSTSPAPKARGTTAQGGEATPQRLLSSILAAASRTGNVVPPDLLSVLFLGRLNKGAVEEDPALPQDSYTVTLPLRIAWYRMLFRACGEASPRVVTEEIFTTRLTGGGYTREVNVEWSGSHLPYTDLLDQPERTRLAMFLSTLGVESRQILALLLSCATEKNLPVLATVAAVTLFLRNTSIFPSPLLRVLLIGAALLSSGGTPSLPFRPTLTVPLLSVTALFLRTMNTVVTVNCLCGFPVASLRHSRFFDGRTFHALCSFLSANGEVGPGFQNLWQGNTALRDICMDLADQVCPFGADPPASAFVEVRVVPTRTDTDHGEAGPDVEDSVEDREADQDQQDGGTGVSPPSKEPESCVNTTQDCAGVRVAACPIPPGLQAAGEPTVPSCPPGLTVPSLPDPGCGDASKSPDTSTGAPTQGATSSVPTPPVKTRPVLHIVRPKRTTSTEVKA